MGNLLNLSGGSLLNKAGYSNLRFDVLTAGTVAWLFYDAATHEPQEGGTAIEYRLNGGSWTPMPPGTTLQVAAGDRLEFRGSSSAYATMVDRSWVSYHGFTGTATANASGHICSLIGGGSTIAADNTFYRLFTHAAVVSARDLILADNVTQHCYNGLFNGCTTLLTPPATLPATTLVSYCYSHMFNSCSSLAIAPTLPATHLATYCYRQMFGNCTSLTTAPELPATTLTANCYYYMFYGCSSLATAPELPAETLVSNCYSYMFKNCSNLNYIKVKCTTKPSTTYSSDWLAGVAARGTFVKTGSWSVSRSTSCVPSNWTVQTVSS